MNQCRAIRLYLGFSSPSPVAGTYTEAGTWPIEIQVLQTGLRRIERMMTAQDGAIFEEGIEVPNRPRLKLPPPHTGVDLRIPTTFRGVRNKCTTRAQAICHEVAALLQDERNGYLHLFTDGSVKNSMGEAAVECVLPELGVSRSCRLPFPASSTRTELAGLHLAADLSIGGPRTSPGR